MLIFSSFGDVAIDAGISEGNIRIFRLVSAVLFAVAFEMLKLLTTEVIGALTYCSALATSRLCDACRGFGDNVFVMGRLFEKRRPVSELETFCTIIIVYKDETSVRVPPTKIPFFHKKVISSFGCDVQLSAHILNRNTLISDPTHSTECTVHSNHFSFS
jgi:hypothetical protein